MNSFRTLVKLFLLQMRQSKALWIICGIMIVTILFYVYTQSQVKAWMDNGLSYDMATRQASGKLNELATGIKNYTVVFVFVISALVAPTSRKNGTSQFVLSFQVSRMTLALAQFLALAIFILAAVLIIHLGFGIMAFRLGHIGLMDLLFGWITLLVPALTVAAASFSLSLSLSPITVYLILLGIPSLVISLAESFFTSAMGGWVPVFLARLVDNIALLFPNPGSLMFWPYLGPDVTVSAPPFPVWSWSFYNILFATIFWVSLGYYFYRSLNIGSRQVLK